VTSAVGETLEYRFRWDAGEHRRFHRALQRAARRGSTWRLALHAWLGFIAALSLLATLGALRAGEPAAALQLASGLVLVAIVYAYDLWWMGHAAARAYARDHAACMPNDQVRLLTLDGLSATCTTSNASVSWAGVMRVEETPEFYLFMTTSAGAIQLPKRAVGDHAQLRSWLRDVAARDGALALRLNGRP